MELKPALCLDLDGTIQHSNSGAKFITGPADVALYPDVEAKLWEYRNEGYLIAGITNQGGVAYGFKTAQGFQDELDALMTQFDSNPFHCVCRCYSHENGTVEPYNHRSLLRKPGIGMLAVIEAEAVIRGYTIDWDNSILVGDMEDDRQCAENAGIAFQWAWNFFNRLNPSIEEIEADWDIWEQSDRDLYGDK